jgi:hypothetical protein
MIAGLSPFGVPADQAFLVAASFGALQIAQALAGWASWALAQAFLEDDEFAPEIARGSDARKPEA